MVSHNGILLVKYLNIYLNNYFSPPPKAFAPEQSETIMDSNGNFNGENK